LLTVLSLTDKRSANWRWVNPFFSRSARITLPVTYCSMLPPESAVFAADWFLVLFQGFTGTPLRVSAYRTFGQMATYGP